MKKFNFIIIFLIFFFSSLNFESKANDCLSLSEKSEFFCKSLILNSYKYLNEYSSISNKKNLLRELNKCKKFKQTFPTFCEIGVNYYSEFIIIFLIIFFSTNFIVYYLMRRNVSSFK